MAGYLAEGDAWKILKIILEKEENLNFFFGYYFLTFYIFIKIIDDFFRL